MLAPLKSYCHIRSTFNLIVFETLNGAAVSSAHFSLLLSNLSLIVIVQNPMGNPNISNLKN